MAMKSHTEYLWFNTKKHREFVNITSKAEDILEKSRVKEGMLLVSAMHITAGVYINDAEDGLIQDIEEWLNRLAPEGVDYRHHRTGETNGDAHLKNLLFSRRVLCVFHYIFWSLYFFCGAVSVGIFPLLPLRKSVPTLPPSQRSLRTLESLSKRVSTVATRRGLTTAIRRVMQ